MGAVVRCPFCARSFAAPPSSDDEGERCYRVISARTGEPLGSSPLAARTARAIAEAMRADGYDVTVQRDPEAPSCS